MGKKETRKSRLKTEICPKIQITEDDRKKGRMMATELHAQQNRHLEKQVT